MNRTGDIIINGVSWGLTLLATIKVEYVLMFLSATLSILSIIKVSMEIKDRRSRRRRSGGYSTADEDKQEDNDQ